MLAFSNLNLSFMTIGSQSMEMSVRGDSKKSSVTSAPSAVLHDNYTKGIDISQGKDMFSKHDKGWLCFIA